MNMEIFMVRLAALTREAALSPGIHRPGIATALRVEADEMADRYPDDANGGTQPDKCPIAEREAEIAHILHLLDDAETVAELDTIIHDRSEFIATLTPGQQRDIREAYDQMKDHIG